MRRSKKSQRGTPRSYATNENPPDVNELMAYGRSFPRAPGLVVAAAPMGPTAVRLTMSYSTTVNMTSTVGAMATYVMTGNGLFDPDVTGSGLQPLGFDQYAALYQRYRSIASNIKVDFAVPAATNNANGSFDIAVVPSNTSSVFSTWTAAESAPYSRAKVFEGFSSPSVSLRNRMDTATFMGVPRSAVLADDTLQAAVSANPTDMWFWHIVAQTSDLSTTSTIYLVIKTTYLVDFFVKQVITLSLSEIAETLESERARYLQLKKLKRASLKLKSRTTDTSD